MRTERTPRQTNGNEIVGEPRRKAPSVKQARYVAGVLEGKSKARAAREAGYAASTAKNAKYTIERSQTVRDLLEDVLEKMGVSNELLARRIREGLDAMETKFFVRQWRPTGAASEAETAAELIRRDVVAFAERRAMVELVIKLKGLEPAQKQEHQHSLEMILEAMWDKSNTSRLD